MDVFWFQIASHHHQPPPTPCYSVFQQETAKKQAFLHAYKFESMANIVLSDWLPQSTRSIVGTCVVVGGGLFAWHAWTHCLNCEQRASTGNTSCTKLDKTARLAASLPMPEHAIDTPALVIDLDLFEKNIKVMSEVMRRNKKDWRPHSKGHKSPAIAQKLLAMGAMGVTVAKLGEAEVMAAAGVHDILIANQIAISDTKLQRLAALRRLADPIVTLDHGDQARAISEAMTAVGVQVRCIIEINLGMERAGVAPCEPNDAHNDTEPAAITLAKTIASLPGLEFVGIMGYEGHLLVADENQDSAVRKCVGGLVATANALRACGLEVPIVSCGGTGSMNVSATIEGVTEIQAGGGIFSDLFYKLVAKRSDLIPALTVVTTVTSIPTKNRIIMDAGRKTLCHWSDLPSMPRVVHQKGGGVTPMTMLCAEHGVLELDPSDTETAASFVNTKIGDRLSVVLAYHDLTVCLHDRFYVVRNGQVVHVWSIEGRGRFD
eukprot:m.243337 g.243337  ORF g.243337 m.243337 type:complete len:489 (-) comp33810_c2_seq13:75-1541(-)